MKADSRRGPRAIRIVGGALLLVLGVFYLLGGLYQLYTANREAPEACDAVSVPAGAAKTAEPNVIVGDLWPLGPHCDWASSHGRIDQSAANPAITGDVYGGAIATLVGAAVLTLPAIAARKRRQGAASNR